MELAKLFSKSKLPVLAAVTPGERNSVKLIMHRDLKTGAPVVANLLAEPFSPLTGKRKGITVAATKVITLSAAELDELKVVAHCDNCESDLRAPEAFASKLDGHEIHCTICGTKVVAELTDEVSDEEADEDEVVDADDESEEVGEDDEETLEAADEEESDDASEEDSEEEIEADDDELEEVETDEEDVEAGDEELPEDESDEIVAKKICVKASKAKAKTRKQKAKAAAEDEELPEEEELESSDGEELPEDEEAEASDEEVVEDESDEEAAEASDDESEEEVADDEEAAEDDEESEAGIDEQPESFEAGDDIAVAKLSVNALKVLSADQFAKGRVDLILAGGDAPVWYVMLDHKPVAVAKLDKASESVKKIFANEDAFPNAFFAATEQGLSDEAAKDFGVEPVTVEFTPDDALKQAVEQATAAATAALKTERSNLEARVRHAITIAAVGVTKGVWKDSKNPLREALVAALDQNGVRNPGRMVDQVFAKHSEELMRVVLSKAFELQGKNDEVRNEVAQFVEQASYQALSGEDAVSHSLTQRLGSGNVVLSNALPSDSDADEEDKAAAPKQEATAGVQGYRRMLKGIGGRR